MLSPEVLGRLEALQPEAAGALKVITAMSQQVTDSALLALCASYIEAALRCQEWHPPEGGLSERDQAFIDFTEQFVTSVSTTSSAQVDRLLAFASADEVYAFVHALYVTDMALRLEIVGKEVLA